MALSVSTLVLNVSSNDSLGVRMTSKVINLSGDNTVLCGLRGSSSRDQWFSKALITADIACLTRSCYLVDLFVLKRHVQFRHELRFGRSLVDKLIV